MFIGVYRCSGSARLPIRTTWTLSLPLCSRLAFSTITCARMHEREGEEYFARRFYGRAESRVSLDTQKSHKGQRERKNVLGGFAKLMP